MKKSFLPFMLVLLISCQKQVFDYDYSLLNINLSFETKTEQDSKMYNVTPDDINKYTLFAKLAHGKEVCEVTAVPEEGETAFYIINYEKGWSIIAADKRCTVLLGEAEEGSFSMDIENENVLGWVNILAEDVLAMKKDNRIPENCSEEELANIKRNLSFWEAISNGPNHKPQISHTKTEIDPDDLGYWELIDVEIDSTYYETGPKLTTTQWHQLYPYNFYCPIIDNNFLEQLLPGSVAIAGAQMAFYLHNKIGFPETAPGSAQLYPYFGNESRYYLTDDNPYVWQYMQNNSLYNQYYSAAMLITQIAYATYTQFHNSLVTYPNITNTLTYLIDYFIDNGVNCSLFSFREDRIAVNLLAGNPVIMSARQTNQSINDQHCFIIDGYKRYNVTYTYTYIWHNEDGSPSYYEPDVVIDPIGLQVTQYCMNWGWGGAFDNAYFVSSANGWSAGGTYYQYRGYAIGYFSPID